MIKVINPCMCNIGYFKEENFRNAYAKIEFDEKKRELIIQGVVAPYANGNCGGSCGQCADEIRRGKPTNEWTPEMLETFCDIWDKWHLNNSRPECEHQRQLGWEEQAEEKIILYHYKLNDDSYNKQSAAKKAAIDSLEAGVTFVPTPEQTKFANMKYFYDTYEKIKDNSELSNYYIPYKNFNSALCKETKTRGIVCYDNEGEGYKPYNIYSKQGLLYKPCPICGYKYGSERNKVKIPNDILNWLFTLPDTKNIPAWI